MLDFAVPFILALLPIIWLVIALCALHMEAWLASFTSLAVCVAIALICFGMTPVCAATAALEGFLFALWPIAIVIIAAVFTYNLTVHTGAMDVIKRMLTSVSADKRVLTLLIGWCFCCFLEGMAGFGTSVAIPAGILVGLGINPITAIVCCLIANGTPTMFGSIGIPTTTLATITGLDPITLGTVQSLQVAVFVVACPIIMVMIVGGSPRALKGVVPISLAAGLSFAIPELLTAHFISANLPDIVGSVVSLIVTFVIALRTRGREIPQEYRLSNEAPTEAITPKSALVSWSPFILIFAVLLLTSRLVPFIAEPLSSIATTATIYAGEGAATLTFIWIGTPGVLIMACGVIGGLIQRCPPKDMCMVLGRTCKQMLKTILTMLGVLGMAKIMSYAGMISAIATFFVVALGSLFPLVSPILGALGAFVTGSGTSSELLFGNVQVEAARAIGVSEIWLAAANSLGISAGKMLAPQSIAIGCAACGLTGKDGEILGRIAPYAFGFVIAMSAIVFAGSLIC